MFNNKPNYEKLKTNLKLVINRLKLLEKKKTEMTVKARRDIAEYIRNNKCDGARIRVEHIIREDYLIEAMEVVEMYCDLLQARMGVLETSKGMADGLEEAVASLFWVTNRLHSEVPEILKVNKQLTKKFGKEYAISCNKNALNNVNEKLVSKLTISTPPKSLVEKYMEEIAKSYKISYIPPSTSTPQDATIIYPFSLKQQNQQQMTTTPPFPGYSVDTPPNNRADFGFDEIAKRFNNLKNN